ncbi:MAG: hypothetical protein J5998_09920 [Clostridia bacterium]|nr:hypothetical protein [Clostridia bacterium]
MKKNIRKIAALSLAACMALVTAGALAEEADTPANPPTTQQTPPSMPGGMNGWNQQTPPSMPGAQDGQTWQTPPSMPGGQGGQSRQTPRDCNGEAQNGNRQKQESAGKHGSHQKPDDSSNEQQQTPDNFDSSNDDAESSESAGRHGSANERQQRSGINGGSRGAQDDGGETDAQSGATRKQTPPELPDGIQPGDGQTPPELPDGMQPSEGQTPPELPGGQMPGSGGGSAPAEYSAASVVTESSSGETYSSEADSENAVLVSSGEVTLSGAAVSKTGSSEGDSADFYGINAAVLASGGATLTIEAANVTSDGAHANGVFSYGEGTTVNVTDTTIATTGDNSGGLMTTGGATLNASNVSVSTEGRSSAAIRSDRGGGTVNVEGGSFATSGVGSPAVYSTADITVANAELSASSSEAVVIEGGNSVTLTNVSATGNDAVLNGQSTVNTNVLIYQSMSGDAAEGSSRFTMTGGSMTALTGDMFHVTNVTTEINLSNVEFIGDGDVFLSASADSWGRSGSNGGHVTLNLSDQSVTGDITVDAASSLSLNLSAGASYTGAVNPDGTAGAATVTLAEGASWTLTGDSYLTGFTGSLSQVNLNGYALYVNGEAAA